MIVPQIGKSTQYNYKIHLSAEELIYGFNFFGITKQNKRNIIDQAHKQTTLFSPLSLISANFLFQLKMEHLQLFICL